MSGEQMTGEPDAALQRAAINQPNPWRQVLTDNAGFGGKAFRNIQIRLSITDALSHGRGRMSYKINVVNHTLKIIGTKNQLKDNFLYRYH